MIDWLIVVPVALVAAVTAWWIRAILAASASAAQRTRVADLEQQAVERARELEALRVQRDSAEDKARAEIERRANAEARLDEERRSAEEKRALLKQAETAFADAFKALSSEALRNNNESFLNLARSTLEKFQEGARHDLESRRKAVDDLVKPLRESLEKVDGKLGEMETARITAYSALNEQLTSLVNTHLPMLHNETANLVKALRQPTVRGRWGEIQLRRVVEMAGMIEHCDFIEQESRTTEDGRLRPDLIVRLPGGKQVVVDAKAPISAYLAATEATDETEQRTQLAEHARQVRRHIDLLGKKNYWQQFDPTPEFVVLFLPGEVFFSAALQSDPSLIEFGVSEGVIPATPTTLIALLRAVAYGWRQEALATNAKEVADLGRELFERIAKLAEHWTRVGKGLDNAVTAYNQSVGSLETRVLVSARRLRDLRAAPDHVEIPPIEPVERTTRELQAPELLPGEGSEGEAAE
jgi:DNA recombination protein RmuC